MSMNWIEEAFAAAQQWLFEAAIQPLMFAGGFANLLEDGFVATGWLIVGLLQIAVLLAVIGPLQRLWPVEPVTDRRAIRTDVLYERWSARRRSGRSSASGASSFSGEPEATAWGAVASGSPLNRCTFPQRGRLRLPAKPLYLSPAPRGAP